MNPEAKNSTLDNSRSSTWPAWYAQSLRAAPVRGGWPGLGISWRNDNNHNDNNGNNNNNNDNLFPHLGFGASNLLLEGAYFCGVKALLALFAQFVLRCFKVLSFNKAGVCLEMFVGPHPEQTPEVPPCPPSKSYMDFPTSTKSFEAARRMCSQANMHTTCLTFLTSLSTPKHRASVKP